jgi:hypothetical protein
MERERVVHPSVRPKPIRNNIVLAWVAHEPMS